jgi:hypothetical protein
MKKKIITSLFLLLLIGIGILVYMFNMPHRNIEKSQVDYEVGATELVEEFLKNNEASNNKYLAENGESKILVVSGRVDLIILDGLGQKVVLLKNKEAKMGVSATFTKDSNKQLNKLKIGDNITVKGVIRSGAEYDEDLDLAEDVILEKASLVN